MKLDKAFGNTPPEVHYAIESAFARGEAEMKKRHKFTLAAGMAAGMAAMVAVALAVGGTLQPQPDTLAAPAGKALEAGDAIVYFTEQGKYYHDVADCSGMAGAREGTEREAWSLDKRPCPVCLGGETVGSLMTEAPEFALTAEAIYYNENGIYYHHDEHCSGMRNAALHTLAEAEADGKRPCPVCVGGEAASVLPTEAPEFDLAAEAIYYNVNGVYYHYDEHCSGMQNAALHTLAEAEADGKRPCPVCVGGEGNLEYGEFSATWDDDASMETASAEEDETATMELASAEGDETATVELINAEESEAFALEHMTPDPTLTPEPTPQPTPEPMDAPEEDALPVYYTGGGVYYHGIEDCMWMLGASAHTLSEAEAAGKKRCPVCQPLGEAPHMDLFRKALGLEIGDVYPGYSYHHLEELSRGSSETKSLWVLGRAEGDAYSWEKAVVWHTDIWFAGGAVMDLDCDADTLARIRDRAAKPVASMLGADLDALARANGRDFPGLQDLPGATLRITFDDSGATNGLTVYMYDAADVREAPHYTVKWSAIDGGFQLDRIADESDGAPDWDVPAGLVTVTG